MPRLPFCVLLALALALPAAAQERLRVATYNLLNLFDTHDDPYTEDEGTAPKSREEIAVLRATIAALDADVLAVQEVENRGVLEALNAGLPQPYPCVELLEGNDARGIDVGLLSRFRIVRALSHRGLALDAELASERRLARDFVVFELELAPGRHLLVAPLHLKSKRSSAGDPQSASWRLAEAKAIADGARTLRERGFDAPFVLLGDLNDTRDSAALAPLFALFEDACAGLPAAERWTYEYSGERSQIDHVLWLGELTVANARIVHDADGASDHAAVVVDFAAGGPLQRLPVPPRDARTVAAATPPFFDLTKEGTPPLRAALLREVRVRGQVVSLEPTRSGGHMTVGLGGEDGQKLELFVRRDARGRFAELESWKGRILEVVGPLSQYRGRLQIELTRPAQLR